MRATGVRGRPWEPRARPPRRRRRHTTRRSACTRASSRPEMRRSSLLRAAFRAAASPRRRSGRWWRQRRGSLEQAGRRAAIGPPVPRAGSRTPPPPDRARPRAPGAELAVAGSAPLVAELTVDEALVGTHLLRRHAVAKATPSQRLGCRSYPSMLAAWENGRHRRRTCLAPISSARASPISSGERSRSRRSWSRSERRDWRGSGSSFGRRYARRSTASMRSSHGMRVTMPTRGTTRSCAAS